MSEKHQFCPDISCEKELFLALLEIYVDTVDEMISITLQALDKRDIKQTHFQIHSLKTTVGTLGTELEAFKLTKEIERKLLTETLTPGNISAVKAALQAIGELRKDILAEVLPQLK